MISYYNSKHPGLFIYIALVLASALSFLLIEEISSAQIGILSILWGSFIFMRILSLYEVSEHFAPFTSANKAHSKATNKTSSPLAHDLLHRMNGQNHMKRGIFAMHAMEGRSLLWFALAFIYVAYNFYSSQSLVSQISLIENFSVFFMIGAGFWAGQTYSYSDHASKLLFTVFALLFGFSLFKAGGSINYGELSFSGDYDFTILSLAALMAYCAAALFYSFAKGGVYIVNAIMGLLLITIMSALGFALEDSSQSIATWISGWSLFSIFWVRSHCRTYKRYVLYQCE